jgi:hypothetical protein
MFSEGFWQEVFLEFSVQVLFKILKMIEEQIMKVISEIERGVKVGILFPLAVALNVMVVLTGITGRVAFHQA